MSGIWRIQYNIPGCSWWREDSITSASRNVISTCMYVRHSKIQSRMNQQRNIRQGGRLMTWMLLRTLVFHHVLEIKVAPQRISLYQKELNSCSWIDPQRCQNWNTNIESKADQWWDSGRHSVSTIKKENDKYSRRWCPWCVPGSLCFQINYSFGVLSLAVFFAGV